MKGVENAAVLGLLPVPPPLGTGYPSHHFGIGDEPSPTAVDVLQCSFACIKEGIPYVLRQARDLGGGGREATSTAKEELHLEVTCQIR